MTAATTFGFGVGALSDAARSRRPLGVLAALPPAVLGAPSAVVLFVFRMIEPGVRRTVGQVRYDGRVLLTVVPHGGPRPRASVLVAAAAAGIAAVVLLGTVVDTGLGALPQRVRGSAAVALTLAIVGPLRARSPSPGADSADVRRRAAEAILDQAGVRAGIDVTVTAGVEASTSPADLLRERLVLLRRRTLEAAAATVAEAVEVTAVDDDGRAGRAGRSRLPADARWPAVSEEDQFSTAGPC